MLFRKRWTGACQTRCGYDSEKKRPTGVLQAATHAELEVEFHRRNLDSQEGLDILAEPERQGIYHYSTTARGEVSARETPNLFLTMLHYIMGVSIYERFVLTFIQCCQQLLQPQRRHLNRLRLLRAPGTRVFAPTMSLWRDHPHGLVKIHIVECETTENFPPYIQYVDKNLNRSGDYVRRRRVIPTILPCVRVPDPSNAVFQRFHTVGRMHNARLSRGDNVDIPYSRNEACVSGLCIKYRIIGAHGSPPISSPEMLSLQRLASRCAGISSKDGQKCWQYGRRLPLAVNLASQRELGQGYAHVLEICLS
ncbi:hypothetical protein F5888DRAFT_1637050 [Russula emetica]|nr:hypothetical protein F5888DRAFT_1637050 [Russula emetica]